MIHARLTLIAIIGILLIAIHAPGQGNPSPVMPPQSNAFGLPFDQWNLLQTQLGIETELGGRTDLSPTVRNVQLLPSPIFGLESVFNVTLRPGTPFVAAPLPLFGERYDDPNVPDDDPVANADFLDDFFATTEIQTVLDGRILLEGTGAELEKYMFGPIFFDAPIVYAEPQPRGVNLNAIAALWAVGIGSVYRPLPIGEHTLVYTVHTQAFGDAQFTYNITVTR
jgi:hypothetical protein